MTRLLVHACDTSDHTALCRGLASEEWEVAGPWQDAERLLEGLAEGAELLLLISPGACPEPLGAHIRDAAVRHGVPMVALAGSPDPEWIGVHTWLEPGAAPELLALQVRAVLRRTRLDPGARMQVGDRPVRILVADDSATYRAFLHQELADEGYVVVEAEGGEEALEQLATREIDAFLLDLSMPGMSGLDVCAELRRRRRLTSEAVPVLMVTGREDEAEMTRCLEAGADDFVGKSSPVAVVKARVRALLRRRILHREALKALEELRHREHDVLTARAEQAAAEARAALSQRLAEANAELEGANLQLRQTQSQLVHSEKMASLGQLAAGVAHEINNPLAYVSSRLYSARERLARVVEGGPGYPEPSRVLERVMEGLEQAADGVARVQGLVGRLRTFSRLDEGTVKTIDPHDAIESALEILTHRVGSGVTLVREFHFPGALTCLAGEFNQMVLNLVANALDAVEGTGEVVVATRRSDEAFVLTVSDSGPGVPARLHNRVFEPFFTTKPVGSGTGLGLSIVHQIVQAHGGRVHVDGAPGGGARFVVSLPLDADLHRCLPGIDGPGATTPSMPREAS